MAEKILQNDALDGLLSKEGYVVVPFLSQEKVGELSAFFHANHPDGVTGFYATAHATDIAFRNRMNGEIKATFAASIASYFDGCTPLGGSFIVKSNIDSHRLHPHQDWNIVDEDNHRSFNIWVPLVDLNTHNGAIRVLPRSHRWTKNFRGPNIPDQFDAVREDIWKQMTPLHLKAGEALIYDHGLFHASDPNVSGQPRLTAVFGIKPEKAAMFYYYGREGNVEVYDSSVDFFMTADIQRGPDLLPLKKIIPNKQRPFGRWKLRFTQLRQRANLLG